jgi:hypothetical protein
MQVFYFTRSHLKPEFYFHSERSPTTKWFLGKETSEPAFRQAGNLIFVLGCINKISLQANNVGVEMTLIAYFKTASSFVVAKK